MVILKRVLGNTYIPVLQMSPFLLRFFSLILIIISWMILSLLVTFLQFFLFVDGRDIFILFFVYLKDFQRLEVIHK